LLLKVQDIERLIQQTTLLGKYIKRGKHEYLAQAAQYVSQVATEYLQTIGTDYAISVRYSEDTLNVVLDSGPTDSYAKLSSGQKRRVDICLCLAMSELSASVGAVPRNAPLVIDEAFDTLDNAGVEAMINLACELSKERQVFLVSHAEPNAPLGPLVRRLNL
jgi:DNA repair exonuclease SbcCD ATPase subunit